MSQTTLEQKAAATVAAAHANGHGGFHQSMRGGGTVGSMGAAVPGTSPSTWPCMSPRMRGLSVTRAGRKATRCGMASTSCHSAPSSRPSSFCPVERRTRVTTYSWSISPRGWLASSRR